jgi:hypothetical protein
MNKNGTVRTKNISYYSHPHFIRGERHLVRYMVRCKVKGTGRKRHDSGDDDHMDTEQNHFDGNKISSEDDDDDYFDDDDDDDEGAKHDTRDLRQHIDDHDDEELQFYDGSNDRHRKVLNSVIPDTEPNKDMMVLNDGDVAFFEGSPFRFLNSHHIEFDSSLPTSDIADVPLMMLPTTQTQLESGDIRENSDFMSISSNPMTRKVYPQTYQKTILLDNEYNQYRLVPDTASISKDPNIIGVFDQHFYDIDQPEPTVISSSSASKLKNSTNVVKPLSIFSWNDVPCDMNIASI